MTHVSQVAWATLTAAVAATCVGCAGGDPSASGDRLRGAPAPTRLPAIAFSYGGRIHVMAPDGSRRVRFTGGRAARRMGGDEAPTWSPDGETLAFVRRFEGGPLGEVGSRIYLLGAGGGRARRLSPLRGGPELHPAWSPDGRRIAFVRGGKEEDDFDSAIGSPTSRAVGSGSCTPSRRTARRRS